MKNWANSWQLTSKSDPMKHWGLSRNPLISRYLALGSGCQRTLWLLLQRTLCLAMFSVGIQMSAYAEQKIVFNEYEVHYIGLTSSELNPEVAEIYGIKRSRLLGYLSISVLKKAEPLPKPVDAEITGKVFNLLGQSRELSFKRIQEAEAYYFISTFDFDDGDMYRFELDAKPLAAAQPLKVKFSQRFYAGQ